MRKCEINVEKKERAEIWTYKRGIDGPWANQLSYFGRHEKTLCLWTDDNEIKKIEIKVYLFLLIDIKICRGFLNVFGELEGFS